MDLGNHERRTWMPAYALTIQALSTLLVGIRFLSRVNKTGGSFGLDDVFIAIAWAIATVNIGLVIKFSYSFGLDRHIWDVPLSQWAKGAEYSFIMAGLFVWSSCLTKISILLFYRRLVAGTASKRFIRAVWAGILFIVAFSIVLFTLLWTACTTLEAHWMRLDPKYVITHSGKYKCSSVEKSQGVAQFGGVLSVVTDFYTVALPAVLLFRTKLSRRQRIGLLGVFALGALVVIAGVIRTIQLSKVQGFDFDKTWLGFNVFVAGIAEGNIGIICACAPSIKSCFRAYFRDHSTHVEMEGRQSSASDERRLVSRGTTGEISLGSKTARKSLMVPLKSVASLKNGESKCDESVNIEELYDPDIGPDVPKKDGESPVLGSRPSRVYFTITDEDALPLSEFPMPPRT
ncbi:hypothetical protein E6O75_ATG11574 [Venturia nashicola]|uniref:Rhodopsin domain-containing protein n=1 Tax=Venturia nashicola TaxID=86259 RepID=A0A4Z1NKU4_9PEZI|nr:hypothetical protein E6O75_ATG11574 [Venturia nashicola]